MRARTMALTLSKARHYFYQGPHAPASRKSVSKEKLAPLRMLHKSKFSCAS